MSSFAQNETSKWYFGHNAGLDFSTSPPTVITGSLNTQEGCSSISDANGNLLFYTDGVTIYDQTHSSMPGIGPCGNTSTSQSALIAKQPGNSNIYYVFTLGPLGTGQLCATVVDMSLASGMGSMTVSYPVHFPCMEQMTAVKHCNGVDVWLIYHEAGNSNFMAQLLTSSGLSSTPVVSSIGTCFSNDIGCLKASPNGKKIAAAYYSSGVQLFDFDAATGVISNSLALVSNSSFGCEFSPDGTKLYATSGTSTTIQWNLCAGSNSAIASSAYNAQGFFGALQLAPDGKIYGAGWASMALCVIGSPNSLGSAMNSSIMSIAPKQCELGLPEFVSSYFNTPNIAVTYSVDNSTYCHSTSFSINSCAASGYTFSTLKWIFGDPLSGTSNTSSINNPTHIYTALGTYTTTLVLTNSCGHNDTIRKEVLINTPCFSIATTSVTCMNLGSGTITSNSGNGPFLYSWMPSGQTGSVATNLSPGYYTITVTDLSSSYTYTENTYLAPLVPLTGNISTGSVNCYGASTGIGLVTNISGGTANQYFSWTNGSVTHTTLNTPTIGILSAGVWTIQVTDALTGCQFSQVDLITQAPASTLQPSSNSPSACPGGSIVLNGVNSGGTPFLNGPAYTYSWISGPASNAHTVTEATSGTYVYTLTSTDSLNCLTSKTIAIIFVPNPTLTVSNVSICPLEIGTLNASGASSYTWNGVSVGSSFNDSPATNTQYTVVGTALSCTSSATASIILKPLPFISIGISSPLCENDNLSMAAYGGTAYAWSGPSGFVSSQQSPQMSGVLLAQNGVYTVTVTGVNSCTASTQGTLQVNANPVITITPVGSICSSQTLNLSASSLPGASYLWSGPQNFSSTAQNTFVTNPPSGSLAYNVKVTSTQNCTNIAVVNVSVVPPPSLNVSLSSSSMCAQALNGSPNSITLTSSGADTYTLNTPAYISNTAPSGTVSPIGTQPPYNSGISTATLYGSNGVCTVFLTASFNVVANPTIGVNSNTPVICAGETFTYTSFGALSYTWGANSTALTTYSMGQVAVGNPSINSMFSVMGGSLGCYSAIKTVSIDVHPIPNIKLGPSTPTMCLNKSLELFATGDGTSFLWQPSNGLSSTSGTSVFASLASQQNYTVIASALGCTNSAMITVSILPLPIVNILNTKNRACVNGEIILEAAGGKIYNWTGPNSIHSFNNPFRLLARSANDGGMYTVTVTDERGCQSVTITEVFIDPLPEGYLKGNLEACAPFSSEFYFQKSSNSSDHIKAEWELNGRPVSNKGTFSYSFKTAGDYVFTGHFTDTLSSCVNTNTFLVQALPQPIADFEFEPAKPVEGMETVVFVNTSKGERLSKFNWYFVNNSGFTSLQKNTSYHFANAGKYPVVMLVEDANGCKDSIVKTIEVLLDFTFYIPNAFTPNNDDRNEIFIPVTRGVKMYELLIFNRWGDKIFQTTDLNKGWDGTFRGESCKQDSYVWKVKLTTVEGEEKNYSGNVILLRSE